MYDVKDWVTIFYFMNSMLGIVASANTHFMALTEVLFLDVSYADAILCVEIVPISCSDIYVDPNKITAYAFLKILDNRHVKSTFIVLEFTYFSITKM